MNDQFGRLWMEVIMVWCKVLSQRFPRRTEENHERTQDSRSRGRDLNSRPNEYETGLLTTTFGDKSLEDTIILYVCLFWYSQHRPTSLF